MKDFEVGKDYRVRLKLPDVPEAARRTTPDGVAYVDYAVVAPGTSNVLRLAEKFCRGTGIDVGSSYFGRSEHNGFPGAVGVDVSMPGSGRAEALVQGYETQDYVFASHLLEHVGDPERALAEAHRVLKPGGVLFTYSPFPGHPDWDPARSATVREEGGHLWQPSPGSLSRLMVLGGFRVIYCEWEPDHIHSFVVVGRKVSA